jgi:divalent metal cation (Fe/Co/Zn/Cd) transporter
VGRRGLTAERIAGLSLAVGVGLVVAKVTVGVASSGDVEISARDGRLVAHVVEWMPGGLTLEHAHEVESELEERIRQDVPEVQEVVARATV